MRRYSILRGIDDPNYVMIDLEFDSREEAEALLVAMRQVLSPCGRCGSACGAPSSLSLTLGSWRRWRGRSTNHSTPATAGSSRAGSGWRSSPVDAKDSESSALPRNVSPMRLGSSCGLGVEVAPSGSHVVRRQATKQGLNGREISPQMLLRAHTVLATSTARAE